MPKVPIYDNFQIAETPEREVISAGQPVTQSAELGAVAGRQGVAMGSAMMRGADALSNIIVDMQKDVNEARVKERDVEMATKHEAIMVRYGNMQGKNAVDGYKTIKEETAKLQTELAQGFDNDMQKRMWADVSNKRTLAIMSNIDSHWMTQTRQYQDDQSVARIERSARDMGVNFAGWNKPDSLYEKNRATLLQEIDLRGARRGWDEDTVKAEKEKALTIAHTDVVGKLLSTKQLKEASQYLKDNAGEIDGKTYNVLTEKAKVYDVAQDAMDTAKDIWSRLGPQGLNDPVKMFEMDKDVDRIFAKDPEKAKMAKDELRSRKQSHDSEQSEINTSNINIVLGMLRDKKTWAEISKEDPWRNLPETDKQQIKEHEMGKAIQAESLAATRASRAFTNEQRALVQQERKMAGAFFSYNDPTVLENMTRPQVQALLPKLGERYTNTLLQNWQSIQTSEGKIQSKMEVTQFNALAEEFKLRPYKDNKTEEEKQMLGFVHSRVNDAIQAAQSQSRLPLQPEQKEAIMRNTMAITVKRDVPWYKGGGTEDVPAVQVKPDDPDLIVPDAERAKIIRSMKAAIAEDPSRQSNPMFAATEANIKNWFLQKRITGRK